MFSPVASFLAFLASFLLADAARSAPQVTFGEAVELTARIRAVDPVARIVTITGPFGNTVMVRAGPAVQNLDQLRPGDHINILYYQQTAFALRKHDGPPLNKDQAITQAETSDMNMSPPTVAVQDYIQVAPPGAMPGEGVVQRVEISATVKNVDYRNRVVTLYGPANTTRVIFVDPSVPGLSAIRPGDRIVTLITQAFVIDVTP